MLVLVMALRLCVMTALVLSVTPVLADVSDDTEKEKVSRASQTRTTQRTENLLARETRCLRPVTHLRLRHDGWEYGVRRPKAAVSPPFRPKPRVPSLRGHLPQCKRQIFREQVLPHSGGKIPEEAFRADRLALNRLNKDGISVPDGIVLDARRRNQHHQGYNSDLEMSVIKLVLTPDGRYVPPEGRYHYENPVTVDSTYIIRPPIGSYKHQHRHRPSPPRRPIPVPLEIPSKTETAHDIPLYLGLQDGPENYFFQSHHGLFSDHFYPFYSPQSLAAELEALFEQFHDHGRLARQSPHRIYHSEGSKIPGVEEKDYPSYTHIPETGFSCDDHRQRDKMYADPRARCQVFHFCQKDGRRDSFLCPKGTVFNQALSHCDWWYNVKCG